MAALWLLSRSSGFEVAALRRQPAAPLIFYFYFLYCRSSGPHYLHSHPPCLHFRLLSPPLFRPAPRPFLLPADSPPPSLSLRSPLPAPASPRLAPSRAAPFSAPSPRPLRARLPARPSRPLLSRLPAGSPVFLPPLENRPAVHCRGGVYNLLIKNAAPRWTNRRHALSLSSYKVSPPASAGAG